MFALTFQIGSKWGEKTSFLTPLLFVILISFVNCFFIDVGKYLGIQCLEIPDRWSDPRVIINSECSSSQRYPSLGVNGQAAHGPCQLDST